MTILALALAGACVPWTDSSKNQPADNTSVSAAPATGSAVKKAPPKKVERKTATPVEPKEGLTHREDLAVERKPAKERVEPGPVPSHDALKDANKVRVERASGYRVPVEYLVFSSKHFPAALASVALPSDYDSSPKKSYPLILAFGGAGECMRAPRDGALAWVGYYKTDEAAAALKDGDLKSADFRGLANRKEIASFNKRLGESPYQGVILACPYSPRLRMEDRLEAPGYERFVMDELIPEIKRRYRVAPNAIGVDGVSMGGARSLYYGFKYPETFHSIGAVQGAFGPYFPIYEELATKNRDILRHRSIQLITSKKDFMLKSVIRMHKMLVAMGIPHEYSILSGPHDYIFNQGPGAIALLMFHDRALRSLSEGPRR